MNDTIKWKRTAFAAMSINMEVPAAVREYNEMQYRRDSCFSQAVRTSPLITYLATGSLQGITTVT